MTYYTEEQQQKMMVKFQLAAEKEALKAPPYFYPVRGMDFSSDFSYMLRIISWNAAVYKHNVNRNYVACHGPDLCIHCHDGTRRSQSMALEIEVMEDPRLGVYSQRHMHLRWDIKPELIRVILRAIKDGTNIFKHPFRLRVLKKKDCDKPHYQMSQFLVDKVFTDQVDDSAQENEAEPVGQTEPTPIAASAPAPSAAVPKAVEVVPETIAAPAFAKPLVHVMTDEEEAEFIKNLVFTEEDFKI